MSSVNNKAFPLRNTIYDKLANIMSHESESFTILT